MIREWTLRIASDNDGSGYLYSGSDVSYPEDDYMEVVEKKEYNKLEQRIDETLKYCENHTDKMWAAMVISILLNIDFRDAKSAIKKRIHK
jgi:chemotaxis regulatin CheY-phosphate phosphatase CheZ